MGLRHSNFATGQVHQIHNWEYADAAARAGAAGLTPDDVGKWAKQLDNGSFWELTDDSPVTWAQRTGSGVGGAVSSVNGLTGAVVLDPDDLDDTSTTNKFTDAADISKLAGIEALADVTDAGNVGAAIHGASAKTTPVDADTMPLIDSAASNVLKKVTWANVKATLKTYFDTLYAAVSHTHTAANITDFTEAAQDAVGAALTDSSSIDFTYTDGSDQITAAVILEWLQDTVAAMFTGGSHTNLTATYQDATGVVDLAASGGGGGAVGTDAIWDAKGDLAVGTGANTAAKLTVGSNGQRLKAASGETTGILWFDDYYTVNFVIDGGGSVITTGIKGDAVCDVPGTIVGATALADQTGSIVVDIWKDTYANYPPVDADSITASAPVTISSATKSQDTTLTGWSTTINAGDILRFNVDSATTVTRVTVSLKIKKS